MTDVYLLNGARTPVGSFLGSLSSFSASDLGAHSIKHVVEKNKIDPSRIDEVFMGQVVQAGSGQAPARQAAIKAGSPHLFLVIRLIKSVALGLKTVITAAQSIRLEITRFVSLVEWSLSNAPHLIQNSRSGHKYGNFQSIDALQNDGLWDVYNDQPMGNCAEVCVEKYNMTRRA